jgi:hypothetical protein
MMCSHQRTGAAKYLFPQTPQGLQIVQPSARAQIDELRKLAQGLSEQDNQLRIFDDPKRVRNISDLYRCFVVMSDRPRHVLDWFHLSMRVQHVAQSVRSWPDSSLTE